MGSKTRMTSENAMRIQLYLRGKTQFSAVPSWQIRAHVQGSARTCGCACPHRGAHMIWTGAWQQLLRHRQVTTLTYTGAALEVQKLLHSLTLQPPCHIKKTLFILQHNQSITNHRNVSSL
ncbi:hypothetical protein K505DRAFT_126419 [Melanomma pulvis-pyrius CBS 109.77]|uniref:Uncharacterized protein n=1 Tax=Melanomma pulvis-pyrius CBS 109.77 TaxID=1314802 RepID=A0A6A6XP28_9PLEO|nr:hypothetical protein K505DRAFT_126419 [Melanomma pulvis-pyrius CBS 109.77]